MSAAELQLHDIDKLNNIVNNKLKKFVADFAITKVPLSPEVAEVLNSKVPVYQRRYKWLPLCWMAFCVYKICSQYENPGNIALSAIFMFFWYDFFSGLIHIVLDNPDFIPFPVIGTPCLEFQWHHHIPLDLSSKEFLETCGDLNTVTCVLGGIYFGVLNLSSIGCCMACFKILFAYFGQYCHCMAHTPANRRPAWVDMLQNAGVMVSPLEHGIHHKTYDDNFCIGSGICNPLITWCTKNMPANKYFWLISFGVCAAFDVLFINYVLSTYFNFV